MRGRSRGLKCSTRDHGHEFPPRVDNNGPGARGHILTNILAEKFWHPLSVPFSRATNGDHFLAPPSGPEVAPELA